MSEIRKGDKVQWNSPQGEIKGRVTKKVTSDTQIGNKTYRASKDCPKVEVKSEKTGKKAIHNPDSVKKR